MKLSEGFTKLIPSVFLFVFYAASFVALTLALKKIEVSVAYAVWSGVGTALIATIGILYFRESVTALKLISILPQRGKTLNNQHKTNKVRLCERSEQQSE